MHVLFYQKSRIVSIFADPFIIVFFFVFSPSGKLVQIEYALAAVAAGAPSVGIKGKNIKIYIYRCFLKFALFIKLYGFIMCLVSITFLTESILNWIITFISSSFLFHSFKRCCSGYGKEAEIYTVWWAKCSQSRAHNQTHRYGLQWHGSRLQVWIWSLHDLTLYNNDS